MKVTCEDNGVIVGEFYFEDEFKIGIIEELGASEENLAGRHQCKGKNLQ